jgi:NADPH:quinone reductase-like Zn-dependent oxidoreductase
MRQVWITRHGAPEVLEVREAADPIPAPGEVRIRVTHAGVNYAEVMARLGLYPDAPPLPFVPGYEVCGTIESAGKGAVAPEPGTRVIATTRFGGYADAVCVRAGQCIRAPGNLDDAEAAALPVTYLTAHHMLERLCGVRADDTVLVHGAAGGVGTAAIQLCAAVGARVIGTASPGKHEYLRSVGVEPVDYRQPEWPAVVLGLTNGRGVDIALDPIGGRSFRRSYGLLAPGGRLCCFGVSSMSGSDKRSMPRVLGSLVSMPRFRPVAMMNDNRGVLGVNLGRLWDEDRLLRPQLERLVELAADGRIRPVVDRTFALEEAAAAHRYLQERRNVGKLVLEA